MADDREVRYPRHAAGHVQIETVRRCDEADGVTHQKDHSEVDRVDPGIIRNRGQYRSQDDGVGQALQYRAGGQH